VGFQRSNCSGRIVERSGYWRRSAETPLRFCRPRSGVIVPVCSIWEGLQRISNSHFGPGASQAPRTRDASRLGFMQEQVPEAGRDSDILLCHALTPALSPRERERRGEKIGIKAWAALSRGIGVWKLEISEGKSEIIPARALATMAWMPAGPSCCRRRRSSNSPA